MTIGKKVDRFSCLKVEWTDIDLASDSKIYSFMLQSARNMKTLNTFLSQI